MRRGFEENPSGTADRQLAIPKASRFAIDNPEPVRVVRSEEVLTRQRYRQGEPTAHATDHEWLWITTLPKQAFPARVVRQLGHSRFAETAHAVDAGQMGHSPAGRNFA